MALIKSIAGIRGTIGGATTEGLNPVTAAQFVAAYAQYIRHERGCKHPLIVVGRDARISGEMVKQIVLGTLMGMGCEIIDVGLATTPTTEMAVIGHQADGGIIITASHNPREWNALKLLNAQGEFISQEAGEEILRLVEGGGLSFVSVDEIGKIKLSESYLEEHIQACLRVHGVDVEAIRKANLRVAFDAVNSVGAIALPPLFEALGVTYYSGIGIEPHGDFFHNPEPLPEHLTALSDHVRAERVDVGFAVDPDVDRLVILDEQGRCIGEEYTLVAIADYLLSLTPGRHVVSNMSSTRALDEVAQKHGGERTTSAVGEVNVVAEMKRTKALIGGEGNGGVIIPELHYGRDALIGIALFLSMMARRQETVSQIRAQYTDYFISKTRLEVPAHASSSELLDRLAQACEHEGVISRIDGVKINLEGGWVHVRNSNTEPIIRIFAEAKSLAEAEALAHQYRDRLLSYL